ncbi:tyrosine-type recombinase/integrase [Schinkia azotoformans]|uniref:tyrosine-type recombinase/integrase n=1 Tax=Schinkia azotoformans TaxID=1454 RepID=UPI002DB78B7B|nr:tyrosine-type recombinase/integrase [Schinkia azotoformans]MEC1759839.1 tyrosine-type recombinase/integrase [Schinkia azotoformans]
MEKRNQPIEALTYGLLEQLELKFYGKDTLSNYRRILKNLALYMQKNEIPAYSAEIGKAFIKDYIINHEISVHFQKTINTVIGRLNDYCEGKKYSPQRKKSSVKLPENYVVLLENYLSFCEKNRNRPGTIKEKRKFCGDFLVFLMSLGCKSIRNIDSTQICKACLLFDNKDAWAVIRMFLNYLYKESIVEYDYSTIVPHYTRPFVIPATYSEDEILRFENAIDQSSKIGIRYYAMLLLATRLGMRSGDIAGLTFDEIDLEGNSIHIVQEKTLQPLELPLLPEIKDAIMNYIENARPTVNDECRIFLRQNAPYQGITTSAIRFATTKYFRKAGIDISDKKHGLHTFRSSLASSMVNDQVPYDVVRKVLGHTDPDAIKHYAKVDIERLREYTIAVPTPSGVFKAFLNGGQSYAKL